MMAMPDDVDARLRSASGRSSAMPGNTSRSRVAGAVLLVLTLVCAVAVGVADAATKRKKAQAIAKDEMYRCRSASGQAFVGQAIPPECMEADVDVIDRNGRIVRMIPGRKTLEQM